VTRAFRGKGRATRNRRILEDEPLCRECMRRGFVTEAQEIDHILPLHKGGTEALENLQPLCKPCHAEKTAVDMGYYQRVQTGLDGWPVNK
jgi:5-methylcytosine-specific restriction enzyme A